MINNDEDDNSVECSVLICTYKPDWEKLRLTIKSILMQENCIFRIVITDDGSDDNNFDKVKDYLSKKAFSNYKLVSSTNNQGTVMNIIHGLEFCTGEFVKTISPGDYLHGKNVLRTWIDFMRKNQECIMSFCDAIYYRMGNKGIVITKEYAHPQCSDLKHINSIANYLLYDDICLGAATMVRRNLWIKYLKMIVGKVVYAEDNTYRIMMYCGEKFAYLPQSLLLYEYGSGISTSGNSKWGDLLRNDWQATNKIMLNMKPCFEAKKMHIQDYLRILHYEDIISRLWRWIKFPLRLIYRAKYKMFPRKTPANLDRVYITELLSCEK